MSTQLEQHTVEHHGGTTGTVVGEAFYVIGGNSTPFEHFGTVHVVPLDPNGERRTLTSMPTPRANPVAAAVGTRIYTVAGSIASQPPDEHRDGPSTVVEVLDTNEGSWQTCAPLPAQRVKPGLAAVGNILYALGGREDELDADTIFAYDTVKDCWSEVGRLPYGARHGAACSLDGVIYYCGGWTAGPNKGTFQKSLIAFEPQSGKVLELADMPASRTAHAFVACGGALYSLGGVDTEKKPTSTVYRYEIGSDTWTECEPLKSNRAVFACGVAGDEIILAGGWKQMRKEANTGEERYCPKS
ncbi:N-acetylneuraminate epimerase [Gimesia alba]|uniref:N-acetylneuraminate epimerase n=1 Tax=Gimesia alba TaxID=2527973 RepID=A0A517RDQ0_9PLAN|nr:kelch repeat-containing protein [Gimesia alba]QDT41984.1 N-acetylneuraminate epimerase [Gimesia alba]